MSRIFERGVLLSLLLLAVAVRTPSLGRHALWIDESNSVLIAGRDLSSVIDGLANDANPPLYYVLLHFWIGAFGDGEKAVRSLSLLFGVGLVLAVFVSGRKFFGVGAGLGAAFLAAVNPLEVYYSQTARMYTLLPFVALLSMFFLVTALDGRRTRWWIAYALAGAAALFTHNHGFFLLPGAWIAVFIVKKDGAFRRLLLAQAGMIALYLAWFPALVGQATEGARYNWIADMVSGIPLYRMIPASLDAFTPGGALPRYFSYLGFGRSAVAAWTARAVMIALLALGAAALWRGRKNAPFAALAAGAFLVAPLLAASAVSIFIPVYLPGRYDFLVFPAFCLVAGAGLASVRPRVLVPALAAMLLVLSASALVPYYASAPREGDRLAAAYLARNAGRGDMIVFAGPRRSTVQYYLGRLGSNHMLLSYPLSIAKHMGIYDRKSLAADPAALRRDAAEIVGRSRATLGEGGKLWVVDYPVERVNRYLYERLGALEPVSELVDEKLRIYCFRIPGDDGRP